MGRTRVDVPSLTARDVLDVPKSRPKRTGRQLSAARTAARRNPLYAAADPPAFGRFPTARGPSAGQPCASLLAPTSLVPRRSIDNGIDRLLDIPRGKRTSTRVRHQHRGESVRLPPAASPNLRGGRATRSGQDGHQHPFVFGRGPGAGARDPLSHPDPWSEPRRG